MRTFVQKQKPVAQTKSANFAKPGRLHLGQSRDVRSILHLQRTIGNQAVLRYLHSKTEDLEASSASNASTGFIHDFSQIPMHAFGHSNIQTKLKVNAPEDTYEQETDGVADQVMRTPELHHQNDCTCAKGCPKCQTRQSEQSRELSDNPLSRMGNSLALRLDLSSRRRIREIIRDLAEPVQLHTDNEAVRATQDLGARGFAYGNHVTIDSSRYPLGSHEFEKLLVHELTHVRQYQENDLGNSRETEAIATERKMGGHVNHRSAPAANSSVSLTPDHIEAFHLDLESSEVEILLDDGSRITGQVVDTNLRPGRYLVHWDSTRGGLQFDPWPTSEEVISFNISGTVAFRTRFASLRERISASSPVPFTVSEGEMRAEEVPLTTETRPVSEERESREESAYQSSRELLAAFIAGTILYELIGEPLHGPLQQTFGSSHPWTQRMRQHPHMENVRENLQRRLETYCVQSPQADVGGLPSSHPVALHGRDDFNLNTLTVSETALWFGADILNWMSWGTWGQESAWLFGSFRLLWSIQNPTCDGSNATADVMFVAWDNLRLGSATRIPLTSIGLSDQPLGEGMPLNNILIFWYWRERLSRSRPGE